MDEQAQQQQYHLFLERVQQLPDISVPVFEGTITSKNIQSVWTKLSAEQQASFIAYPFRTNTDTHCIKDPLIAQINTIIKNNVIRWDQAVAASASQDMFLTWEQLMDVFVNNRCDVHVLLPPTYKKHSNLLQIIGEETLEKDETVLGPFEKNNNLALMNDRPCFVLSPAFMQSLQRFIVRE